MTTFSNLYDHCYVMHYPRYVLLNTRLNHVLLTVRTRHRDRCVVDSADTGMHIDWKLLGAPRFMWDPTVGRGDPNPGSHSVEPSEEPSEPAPPPDSDAMDSAGLARGMGVAADSGLPEGVGLMGTDKGLDEGAAPGSGEQRQLPQVVLNRRRWAKFCVRPHRYVCQLRRFERIP